jgi:ParB/RepB/Spo0J family partition protein
MSKKKPEEKSMEIVEVSVDKIKANPWNPNEMDAAHFNKLVDDVQDDFSQPVLLRPHPKPHLRKRGVYEIIDGEKRYRAAVLAGMAKVPAIIKDKKFARDSDAMKKTVRMDKLRGKFDRDKMRTLVTTIMKDTGQTAEEIAEDLGYISEDELEKEIHLAKKDLSKEARAELDRRRQEIKTLDDLARILNRLFTKYGDSIPYHFLFFEYGGKKHVKIQMSPRTFVSMLELVEKCRELNCDAAHAIEMIFDQVKWAEFVLNYSSMINKVEPTEVDGVEIIDSMDKFV